MKNAEELLLNILLGIMGLAIVGVMCMILLQEKPVVHSRQWVTYELVGWKPPKHFRVDLRDTTTGKVHRNVYISKHCSRYKELYVGKKFTLEEVVYHYVEAQKIYTEINARSVCPGH